MTHDELLSQFAEIQTENGGIESFISSKSPPHVLDRLSSLNEEPLSKVQLDQLLGLSEERAVSDGFFEYYWLSEPRSTYKLSSVPGYSDEYPNHDKIRSVDHLKYGLYRIYIDGLLYRGNVRRFFRDTAILSKSEIESMIEGQLLDTEAVKRRGPILPLREISKDNRYLISEMACKSYGETPATHSDLKGALLAAWEEHEKSGGGQVTVRDLLSNRLAATQYESQQQSLVFSADDMLDEMVSSSDEINARYGEIAKSFLSARNAALENTKLYLSLVNDLDVYVATSMRTRDDFRKMADRCDEIFGNSKLQDLHLRYFDPTLSAAEGHQDKGLIECLMVKCAKVLVYCAGEKESFGKDAEAAMALSLGKPVIFLCDEQQRLDFYREVHPLSRLINFETGVAVGAMVTSSTKHVSELLDRIFDNEMEFTLRQRDGAKGYLQLAEKLTDSVVRLQTNDTMLSEAFWNYYQSQR